MPLPDLEADAAAFEEWRSLLFGIAYRMLGSAADAEDVVQDASIRWLRRGDDRPVGPRLPRHHRDPPVPRPARFGPVHTRDLRRPVAARAGGGRGRGGAEQADSLSLAFLVLLEELTPLERAAYLLHDIFGYSFEEVARSLGRSPAACRQLGRGPASASRCGASASTPTCSTAAS